MADPGYAVAVRNNSDVPLLVRGDAFGGRSYPSQWLLPPHSAGTVFRTLGPPREAPPTDYEIVDPASCRVLGVQHVGFALAPNPGYSEFIVVVGSDMGLRLDTRTLADQTITMDLETTRACPAT